MRLWTIHPKFLDSKGLLGVWCEANLAQTVLRGLTKGYKNHPQLNRWRECEEPLESLGAYLHVLCMEGRNRGYNLDVNKIHIKPTSEIIKPILEVTTGQVEYEMKHLSEKLKQRDPDRWNEQREALTTVSGSMLHPCFSLIDGPIASWEVIKEVGTSTTKRSKTTKKKTTKMTVVSNDGDVEMEHSSTSEVTVDIDLTLSPIKILNVDGNSTPSLAEGKKKRKRSSPSSAAAGRAVTKENCSRAMNQEDDDVDSYGDCTTSEDTSPSSTMRRSPRIIRQKMSKM